MKQSMLNFFIIFPLAGQFESEFVIIIIIIIILKERSAFYPQEKQCSLPYITSSPDQLSGVKRRWNGFVSRTLPSLSKNDASTLPMLRQSLLRLLWRRLVHSLVSMFGSFHYAWSFTVQTQCTPCAIASC